MVQPIGVYAGEIPNPHIQYGQEDLTNAPTTFARIATRWGDVQLSNGWQRTNYGGLLPPALANYLLNVAPTIPGQTRLSGTHPGDFVMKGAAPSQWDFHTNIGPGSQPNYPGGPGQIVGKVQWTGNSGG